MSKFTEYFKNNLELKIFYSRNSSQTYDYGILYLYIFDQEVEFFKNTFGYYFPYYIKNEDQLNYLNPDNIGFKSNLKKISIRNWERLSIIPQRGLKISGMYGELFLDFYLRIVNELDPLISYASKRSYKSNYESKGIDNVMFEANENIELILSEAKFVSNKSSAKAGLIGDIKGTTTSSSHFTKTYINSYMDFVICKASESNQIKNVRIKQFIDKANKKYDDGVEFLDVCIEESVKLKVVLFAIFNEMEKDVNLFDSIYKELSKELETKLCILGLNSYDYEIVFIPTNNTSMRIKDGINEYYE